ncbi:MAG: hypothetical protein A3F78_07775 [Burkholderiales bacterium RIFCSPLOWO2_12_FULL_61_40]|nr:MAG: hypothetical protein A3F78_07775 [Burkholderiales bacterium RIFCSPLOWO2_12_FULL_61_40]
MKIRVMLADDHALFRDALRMVLEMAPDMEVVAEAENGHQVLDCMAQFQPDVVCMDLSMPGMNGLETTRHLCSSYPHARIIGLSAHADLDRVVEMHRAGALGYVTKANAADELHTAIRQVCQGQTYFSSEIGLRHMVEQDFCKTLLQQSASSR